MHLLELCFGKDASGLVEMADDGIAANRRGWFSIKSAGNRLLHCPSKPGMYFGPALRSVKGKMGKANCKGSGVCWVDLDDMEDLPDTTLILKPSAVVASGGGFHAYWKLSEFCSNNDAIEEANKSLAKALNGDSAHNIDRMLRMPGSLNAKYDPPREVRLLYIDDSMVYQLGDLAILEKLDRKTAHKIITGDRRGYKSRSERDWAVLKALIRAGARDPLMMSIFRTNQCGDKYREEGLKGPAYLERTIKKLRETTSPAPANIGEPVFEEVDNCYIVKTNRGQYRVSTFVLHPTLLLEGEDEDSLVCNLKACGTRFQWEDVVLPRAAFNGVHQLSRYLTKAAWVWLGRDSDVRALLAHLIQQLQEQGVPRAVSTHVLGRHTLGKDGRSFLVGIDSAMASDGSYWAKASDAPIMYVTTRREKPEIALRESSIGKADVQALCEYLPRLNEPGCIWSMLGWFMACPYKPVLEELGYRFPILNITGTKGSGKTTLIVRVFHPMLGYTKPRTYDIGTTKFVTLSLLGSSNAFPVAFSEYRVATENNFTRHVLLAYDTGMDARGNADQTTTQYPLIAPFSLDGEDKMEDPAALERMIVVLLSPRTIEEESPAWQNFQKLAEMDLSVFAYPYLKHTLTEDVGILLKESEQAIHKAFPMQLPDRVRRNLIVAWVGVLSFSRFVATYEQACTPPGGAGVLLHALDNVYSTSLGRAPIAADEFVEYVVNGAALGDKRFPWILQKGILWFQLAPAYESFIRQKAQQRRNVLSKNALRVQLSELRAEYMQEAEVMKIGNRVTLAYGIDVVKASESGLDVPSSFNTTQVLLNIRS